MIQATTRYKKTTANITRLDSIDEFKEMITEVTKDVELVLYQNGSEIERTVGSWDGKLTPEE